MKILVVDDDTGMTDLLKILLSPHSSDILVANSGLDGINMVKTYNPDVMILDLMMPEMDGCQVCKEVRRFSPVPILILSAMDNPGMVAQALDAGADDYVIKPVPGGVLIAHLNKLVKRVAEN